MKRSVAALVLALLVAGCTTEKKEEGPPRPVRFAVIAAPEVGGDDGDLLLAITKLSREPELDFVLVPGPLLAKDADATSLELLKNDLGQIAPPVYVGFAHVTSASATTLRADEILTALEKMGPGQEHAVAYNRTPPRQPNVVVNVVGPDGRSGLENTPEGKLVVTLGRAAGDLLVRLRDVPAVEAYEETARASPELDVPPLSRAKVFVIATIWPTKRVEVQPVALDGPNPPARSILIPVR